MEVELITDGACRGNPGPGGWAALLRKNNYERVLSGAEAETTNNRMELTAVIEGLAALSRPCKVHLVTDSRYVLDGLKSWLVQWKRRGWKTSGRQPVKNQDLWMRLDELALQHQLSMEWVKGHSGHPGNEAADQLANEAIDAMLDGAKP